MDQQMTQLEQLIDCFFQINPHPADAQIHALAGAVGVDKETLEAVIYKMFGEQNSNQNPALSAPAIASWVQARRLTARARPLAVYSASMTDRILQDAICEDVAPTNPLNDGSHSVLKDEMIKEITFSDGAPIPREAE